jgi:1-acyl-sn-glycerol-3-phosphate acyltransferase
MAASSGLLTALGDFAGALLPLSARELERQLAERLRKAPIRLNEYGFDPYGMNPAWWRRVLLPLALLYRYYFRVETHGIDQLPGGRVLVVANHAGQLPFDGAMLGVALLLEAEPPRIARPMGEYWIPSLPWVSIAAARTGALVGTPSNCAHMLENGECVTVFPEGVRGMNKLYAQRYRLQRFGLGFMRLALQTRTPIVPVGIVGSEEQQPGLLNLARLGKLLGMPAFPITPTFPWLGPLGLLPLPVKYRLHFGAPLHFEGEASEEDTEIEARVDEVKAAITGLLEHGRRARRGVFR